MSIEIDWSYFVHFSIKKETVKRKWNSVWEDEAVFLECKRVWVVGTVVGFLNKDIENIEYENHNKNHRVNSWIAR